MKSINRKDFIEAGTIAKTHGTKGEIKVITTTKIKFTEWAFLQIREKPVPFYILSQHMPTANEYHLLLQGINSLEEAQEYVGYTLLVQKSKSQKSSQNAFNLNGFLLVDNVIGTIGKIAAIEELPQQIMFVTHYKEKQVLIPMVEDFIADIDEEKEIIYLNLPEGFWDLYP